MRHFINAIIGSSIIGYIYVGIMFAIKYVVFGWFFIPVVVFAPIAAFCYKAGR